MRGCCRALSAKELQAQQQLDAQLDAMVIGEDDEDGAWGGAADAEQEDEKGQDVPQGVPKVF